MTIKEEKAFRGQENLNDTLDQREEQNGCSINDFPDVN